MHFSLFNKMLQLRIKIYCNCSNLHNHKVLVNLYKTLTKSRSQHQCRLASSIADWMCCMSSTATLLLMRTCLNHRTATYCLVSAIRSSLKRVWVAARNTASTDCEQTALSSWVMSDDSDKYIDLCLSRSWTVSVSARRALRQHRATVSRKCRSSL